MNSQQIDGERIEIYLFVIVNGCTHHIQSIRLI